MMKLTLTHQGATSDISGLVAQLEWSGDKLAIGRKLEARIACAPGTALPEIGDRLRLYLAGELRFDGRVLIRSMDDRQLLLDLSAMDDAYHLGVVDGTWKWTGVSPEAVTRACCQRLGLTVAETPHPGCTIRRKFAGVPLSKILRTAWTLAGEKTGKQYAIRYEPGGLRVLEQGILPRSLVLSGAGNLMSANTREDASHAVNSVAVYDSKGNLLRRSGDPESQKLIGLMEKHIRQTKDGAAEARDQEKRLLEEGKLQRIVNVSVVGDPRLLTGSTVVVEEAGAGLSGLFWIEADRHLWKNGLLTTRLTLNCRNVVAKETAGSKVK